MCARILRTLECREEGSVGSMPWKPIHRAGVGSRLGLTTLMAWVMAFPGALRAQASGAGGAQPTVPGPAGLTAAPVPFGPG